MNMIDIVRRLTGPIHPAAETHTDHKRLENQVEYMLLAETMVREIIEVSRNAKRQEYSMKQAGEYALKCLKNIKEDIEDSQY